MKEKTTFERLMKRTVDQLVDASLRLGIKPLMRAARKAEWAAHLAEQVPQVYQSIVLQMYEVEYMALSRAVQEGQQITLAQANRDEWMLAALTTLECYGQAWRTTSHWQFSDLTRQLMTPDEELLDDLRFHDILYDEMEGWLLHVGMMPVDVLLARISDAQELPDERREMLRDLSFMLLMARKGMDALYPDPDGGMMWARNEDLDDPDALIERVKSPAAAQLDYPDFTTDELIRSVRLGYLPGDSRVYEPLAAWMVGKHRVDKAEYMDTIQAAVYLLQNGNFDETVNCIMDTAEPRSEKDAREGMEAIMHFVNNVPLWDNKGHSASEMARTMMASEKQKMPGRNDPCPCGSGKKYKQCCGRLVN